MYNTTTEPTIVNHITIGQIVLNCIGMSSLTFVMIKMMYQWIYEWNERNYVIVADDADDSDDADENDEFNKKYEDEFKVLKERKLDEVDFLTLSKKWVNEETPGGNVVMNYDKETECFVYYTDHLKQITYGFLETVARKFVVENDCKIIYIHTKMPIEEEEEEEEEEEVEEEVEGEGEEEDKCQESQVEADKKPSVFAKFKKYNTGGKGSAPNFKSNVNVIEQSNHFRYKGKLYDYNAYKESLKKNDVCACDGHCDGHCHGHGEVKRELDYATFKRQILEKNK